MASALHMHLISQDLQEKVLNTMKRDHQWEMIWGFQKRQHNKRYMYQGSIRQKTISHRCLGSPLYKYCQKTQLNKDSTTCMSQTWLLTLSQSSVSANLRVFQMQPWRKYVHVLHGEVCQHQYYKNQKDNNIWLLLVMISPHMLTFRLMVTMVAEFCPLVILIHNTLQGEITIISTWTTRVNGNIIPLFPSS